MEDDTQSFIVRIWRERADADGNAGVWRGSIQHIPSGQRLHFQDLDRIAAFIADQLQSNRKARSRWTAWLRRLRHGLWKRWMVSQWISTLEEVMRTGRILSS